jgi:hypothetical protein
MNRVERDQLALKLAAVFEAVVAEVKANPVFAEKLGAIITGGEGEQSHSGRNRMRKKSPIANPSAAPEQPATAPLQQKAQGKIQDEGHAPFDPLKVHLEAAIINGRESEARAFLTALTAEQLETVVRAQRVPQAKALQKLIQETSGVGSNPESHVIDAILNNVAASVRGRQLAAS